jgi:hypothetical protein
LGSVTNEITQINLFSPLKKINGQLINDPRLIICMNACIQNELQSSSGQSCQSWCKKCSQYGLIPFIGQVYCAKCVSCWGEILLDCYLKCFIP